MDKIEVLAKWLSADLFRIRTFDYLVFIYMGREYLVFDTEEMLEKDKDALQRLYGNPHIEGNFFIYTV